LLDGKVVDGVPVVRGLVCSVVLGMVREGSRQHINLIKKFNQKN